MFVALNHEIPGLLRKGSPVVERGDCGMRGCEGLVVPSITRPGELAIRWHGWGGGLETSFTHGAALDMSDPTGACHARLWLAERGYDLAWAKEPEVLAWSVRSVALGGEPIRAVVGPWENNSGGWIRRVVASSACRHCSWGTPDKVGTGAGLADTAQKQKAEDRRALAEGYALMDGKEGVVLPELTAR